METDERIAYSFIAYRHRGNIMVRKCYSQAEHDEFMIMLLFDNMQPSRQYKTHWYGIMGPWQI